LTAVAVGYSPAMGLLFRKTVRVGPLQFHFGNRGLSSWGVKVGRWSWNSRTRKQRVDLPGPVSWRSGK
jgi:hypothetical protein